MSATDLELLRAYLSAPASDAFELLVERHHGWILAASRRRLGDEHLADDATQAVFIVLADKAAYLGRGQSLGDCRVAVSRDAPDVQSASTIARATPKA